MKILDMNHIRYLNLFEKICRVRSEYCFDYNLNIVFVLDKHNISRAIGENGKNTRKLHEILGRRIKVVGKPETIAEAREFISAVIYPTIFKSIDVGEDITIQAGRISKASLIGRNKARLEELQEVVKIYFGKGLRIV